MMDSYKANKLFYIDRTNKTFSLLNLFHLLAGKMQHILPALLFYSLFFSKHFLIFPYKLIENLRND